MKASLDPSIQLTGGLRELSGNLLDTSFVFITKLVDTLRESIKLSTFPK